MRPYGPLSFSRRNKLGSEANHLRVSNVIKYVKLTLMYFLSSPKCTLIQAKSRNIGKIYNVKRRQNIVCGK